MFVTNAFCLLFVLNMHKNDSVDSCIYPNFNQFHFVDNIGVSLGRPSLSSKFPEIVAVVKEFIGQHSAAAHNRRWEDTEYCHGVSIEMIRRPVLQAIPELKKISKSTIRRLLLPPQKNRKAACRYTGLVEAKIPPKRNDLSLKKHKDFHFTCAQVNFIGELSEMLLDETVAFSADDKNKLNGGTLVVGRYFNIGKFFMTNDQPNYPDHDFPYSGAKLVPSGYLLLKSRLRRSRSLSPRRRYSVNVKKRRSSSQPALSRCKSKGKFHEMRYRDELGRERISWPRTGQLSVYLYASLFHSSTSALHASHLGEILKPIVERENKGAVTIICDGGPDWSTKFTPNLINYGRLWKNLKIDVLVLTCYAPGHSRFNPIEHCWAPISKKLTGATLPISVSEDVPSPWEDNTLLEEEIIKNKGEVLDHAIDTCKKYWHNKRYDSFPIKVFSVPSKGSTPLERVHKLVKSFSSASTRKIRESEELSEIKEEYQFLVSHCCRKSYQLQFSRCNQDSCEHCGTTPIRAERFLSILRKSDEALPTPSLSAIHRGHYDTMLQQLSALELGKKSLGIDQGLPSLNGKSAPLCPFGCRYVFSSKTDAMRHCRLMNHTQVRGWKSKLPKFK